jgi:hypothetical protein
MTSRTDSHSQNETATRSFANDDEHEATMTTITFDIHPRLGRYGYDVIQGPGFGVVVKTTVTSFGARRWVRKRCQEIERHRARSEAMSKYAAQVHVP